MVSTKYTKHIFHALKTIGRRGGGYRVASFFSNCGLDNDDFDDETIDDKGNVHRGEQIRKIAEK